MKGKEDGREFDAMKLARTLDRMADCKTKPGTMRELASEIERVRDAWPKCKRYPPQVWIAAWRDHLAAHPKGDPARIRFAKTWVSKIDGRGGEETGTLIAAWLRCQRWRAKG